MDIRDGYFFVPASIVAIMTLRLSLNVTRLDETIGRKNAHTPRGFGFAVGIVRHKCMFHVQRLGDLTELPWTGDILQTDDGRIGRPYCIDDGVKIAPPLRPHAHDIPVWIFSPRPNRILNDMTVRGYFGVISGGGEDFIGAQPTIPNTVRTS